MLSFRQYISESDDHGLKKLPWNKDPKIGWWKDHHNDDNGHVTLYHGTHERNLHHIAKHGLVAPDSGPTAHNVSLTHDSHTAHAYASMSGNGGESAFRGVRHKATTTPHHERATLVIKAPRKWVEDHYNKHMRGNIPETRDKLTNKEVYDKHAASGRPDHEHYRTTELRFHHVPKEYIHGYMKKVDK
jgi:hypothetical protein